MRFPDEELQPKPPRASVGWFNTKAGASTIHENLFLAGLVATNGSTAAEMDKWASDIWSRHDAYVSKGVAALGLPPNWSCNADKLDMFAPLKLGYTGTEWSSARLGRICAAMQLWEGKARKQELDAGRLKSHRQNVNARKRWKSLDILFGVANLLRHQGKQLRKLLKEDESVDELPSTWEQLVNERQATAGALQAKEDALKALGLKKEELIRTIKDALRQMKKKSLDGRAAVKQAKEKERSKAKDSKSKALEKVRDGWKLQRGKVVEKAREMARKESQEEAAKMKSRLAAALARARALKEPARLSTKRLRRAQKAEADLKELQAVLEEESEEEPEEEL